MGLVRWFLSDHGTAQALYGGRAFAGDLGGIADGLPGAEVAGNIAVLREKGVVETRTRMHTEEVRGHAASAGCIQKRMIA